MRRFLQACSFTISASFSSAVFKIVDRAPYLVLLRAENSFDHNFLIFFEIKMTQQPKPRKRIIPEQIISPTKAHNGNLAATASPQVEIGDLKVHSTVAAEQLGPGRKIYVDLAEYQKNAKAVDWREVSSAL